MAYIDMECIKSIGALKSITGARQQAQTPRVPSKKSSAILWTHSEFKERPIRSAL